MGAAADDPATALKLAGVLTPDRVIVIDRASKKYIFDLLIETLGKTPEVKSVTALAKGIFEREDLMSTGIGMNLGIPHVRTQEVRDLIVGAALVRNGVPDYESLDSQPVKLIFMIIAREDQHAQHLKLLSNISTSLKNETFRRRLLEAADAAELHRLLTTGK